MNFRAVLALYNPTLAASVIGELKEQRYSGWRLLGWIWRTKTFHSDATLSEAQRSLAVFLGLAMLAQLSVGVGFLVEWARYGTAGTWEFGAALILSYSLIWAHVVVVFAWLWNLSWLIAHPKRAARSLVCTILEWQVHQLRARHTITVVAVVGSVGKTSTKIAIANLLASSGLRVRYQTGNYNDRVTVPLVFFGQEEPSLYNPFAWLQVFGATQSEIAMAYPYDVVVVELGIDNPGQMGHFAYIKPDLTVVTAVSPEHMEYFGTLDTVAAEELKVFDFSKRVLVNADDIPGEYLAGRDFTEYSLMAEQAQYGGRIVRKHLTGQTLDIRLAKHNVSAQVRYLGEQGAKIVLAAAATAHLLGVRRDVIAKGLPQLEPPPGRMRLLQGIKDSTLIDDTYNASPLAAKAALDVLYATKATQRIAILGDMNEMGGHSRQVHEEIGAYCDPKKLDVVVTIGHDTKQWLAIAARARGCTVHSFVSPYDAGSYVSGKLQTGGVVLAKGSQNGVFAEEALKVLLAKPEDDSQLVRQSTAWLKRKARQFPR